MSNKILYSITTPSVTPEPTIPITSGLTVWLKSDIGITKDGSNYVSQWNDQSGNGKDSA